MNNCFSTSLAALAIMVSLSSFSVAQTHTESGTTDELGFVSYVEAGGTFNSVGQIYEFAPSLGYTFTKHFGMDIGLPFYFVNADGSGTESGSGVGNPSVDLRWKFPSEKLSYATVITGAAPLGDKSLGFNTGHPTFDWTNHFEHVFNDVKPFAEAGFSNTTSDSRLFVRPYTSYGLNAHVRGGAEIKAWRSVAIGAAGYDIVPLGNQTVISRVVGPAGNANSTGASHGRGFSSGYQTIGSSGIAGDNGFAIWTDASLSKYADAELGYTRSVYYDLNSISLSLGFNVGRLLRESK